MAQPDGQAATFRVLFVSTAAVGRGPMAARMFRDKVDSRLGTTDALRVIVDVAGTHTDPDGPTEEPATADLATPGGGGWPLAGEPLTDDLDDHNLILTMDRDHRGFVVQRHPRAVRTAFTLREFARLLAAVGTRTDPLTSDPIDRARAAVEQVLLVRGQFTPVPRADDAVPDPAGRPERTRTLATQLITNCVDAIVDGLWTDIRVPA